MADFSENNKRIAKNTIALYIRMLVVLAVNLYTSRIVLSALGVDDFGIYNIVAGVAIMFDFLNTTMSSATSRFLTVELGIGNKEKLKQTFQTALFLHIIIAAIIIIICETAGLWLINEKLVIDAERIEAANFVFQFAILSVAFKVIQVPFMACIISNERMGTYACIEIVRVIATLICVYFLEKFEFDRLILYACIMSVVSFVICMSYVSISKLQFEECSFRVKPHKNTLREMIIYSGWDLYGNMCVTGRTQGINIILNLFFGALLNAANGIAAQINTAVMQLSSNVISAFRPQIIKLYAKNEMRKMSTLVNNSTKLSLVLFSFAAVPLVLEMPYVLELWLINPPQFAVSFSRIAIIAGMLNVVISISNIPIHASGNIKLLSFINGTIFLLTVPAAYVCLLYVNNAELAYMMIVLFTLINVITSVYLLRCQIQDFSIRAFLFSAIVPTFICIVLSSFISYFTHNALEYGFLRLVVVIMINMIILSALSIPILLPKSIIISIKNKLWNH